MTTIKETTQKLFSVNYEKDFEDDKIYEAYLDMAEQLIKNNKWTDVYNCWYDYLINKCQNEDDILNFANLFWCYEGYKQFIPNILEFSGFLYANISFEHHPEAISVLDGIAWHGLVKAGILKEKDLTFDNFTPYDVPLLVESIKNWKKKG